ncbi:MAG: diaminopimelate epimerase, partial [Loigolactobacillus coryniformis]
MDVTLTKVHGSENDFFILDQTKLAHRLSEAELKQATQQVTDRKSGLAGGADGVLYVDDSSHPQVSGKMRVINADGSEASMCGNGIRTVARYLSEQKQQTDFKIETMYADLNVKQAADLAPEVKTFQAEISPVSFQA